MFGNHLPLAYGSLNKGLHKLTANPAKLRNDFDSYCDVLAALAQTVMRQH